MLNDAPLTLKRSHRVGKTDHRLQTDEVTARGRGARTRHLSTDSFAQCCGCGAKPEARRREGVGFRPRLSNAAALGEHPRLSAKQKRGARSTTAGAHFLDSQMSARFADVVGSVVGEGGVVAQNGVSKQPLPAFKYRADNGTDTII